MLFASPLFLFICCSLLSDSLHEWRQVHWQKPVLVSIKLDWEVLPPPSAASCQTHASQPQGCEPQGPQISIPFNVHAAAV